MHQPNLEDCYRILGLRFGASSIEVKRAFFHLARASHPDKTGEASDQWFLEIRAAYERLVEGPPAALRTNKAEAQLDPTELLVRQSSADDCTYAAERSRSRRIPPFERRGTKPSRDDGGSRSERSQTRRIPPIQRSRTEPITSTCTAPAERPRPRRMAPFQPIEKVVAPAYRERSNSRRIAPFERHETGSRPIRLERSHSRLNTEAQFAFYDCVSEQWTSHAPAESNSTDSSDSSKSSYFTTEQEAAARRHLLAQVERAAGEGNTDLDEEIDLEKLAAQVEELKLQRKRRREEERAQQMERDQWREDVVEWKARVAERKRGRRVPMPGIETDLI